MIQTSVKEFLNELESHCSSTAIATFLNNQEQPFVIDLRRKHNRVIYGYQKGHKELFLNKLIFDTQPHASLILRSFTPEIDELTNLPLKEIRGYIIRRQGEELVFEKISPTMMFACQNTDAETGEPLPLEQSVRYC
ncbi:MAG: hypothetical protein DSM107014_07710 [Gomphosphaeria aponina SAG 52.96 = DSM 107014]|uniref:Uncharacterized protein n=1 Tax=Gomphosphaeria aponina SAG 52.96 = DSM 107014 TaxID=1521640 RepID=A0A941GQ14_9CHRO|nr:hypothetical protein [Gomphosphaeria aponina SAG 52.96 = DSM 107014]